MYYIHDIVLCVVYFPRVILNVTADAKWAPPGQLQPDHRESGPEVSRQWRGGGGERTAEL